MEAVEKERAEFGSHVTFFVRLAHDWDDGTPEKLFPGTGRLKGTPSGIYKRGNYKDVKPRPAKPGRSFGRAPARRFR